MFKRKEKNSKGISAAPYSSVPGCIGAIFVVLFGIYAFLNLTEVIKWVGLPFMILPDALGIVDRPSNDEVARIIGPQGSTHEVELTQIGTYNLFRSFWDNWGVEVGEYPGISIEGPNGPIEREYADRNPWLYDTPAAKGRVEGRIEIEEPGLYIVSYEETGDRSRKKFDATLVPDYITGNEAALRWAFIIQIALILTPLGLFVYFRKIKPIQTEVKEEFKFQDNKRDTMDDFLYDLKKDKGKMKSS